MKKFFLLALLSFSLCSCWLKDNPEDVKTQENLKECKKHLMPGDEIVQSERGGTYIIKNNGQYYRLNPSGARHPVERHVRYGR